MTEDQVRHLADTVRDMVFLRLDAGAHPEDVLMAAGDIFETWCRVHCDGAWPKVKKPG